MASGDGTPLSLRPFPVADKKPKNITEFITRVNAQPGGFRSLSEAKLREEAARQAQGNGDVDDEDVDMSDADEDDEAAVPDLGQARMDVLRNIDMAANTAMLTLDSLSLLLSKQNPSQASITLSKQLREVAGIGTLGADRLEETNITEEKEKDRESVALGWTLMEINKTRDSAEAACTFLQDEVESESRYWEDVMGVQSSGWSICKMPQEKHTLGVRFGFSEAAPEFRNNGLAPMRRDEDGSVKLDSDILGGTSERLVITFERGGKVVGRSTIAPQPDNDAPLEARVLEARNTLFAQELWHELSREARTLTAYDVRLRGSNLTYEMDEETKMTAELVPLDSAPPSDDFLPENDTAEAISLALHILLSYAHRHNELIRVRPLPPHIPRSRGPHAYALLRPVIARSICLRNITSSTRYVGALIKTLQKAGLGASFTLQTAHPSIPEFASQGPNQLSAAQLLVRNMLQPPEFTLRVNLVPETPLTVRGRTYLYPIIATYYNISLPPSSPLETLCPPHKDGYTDLSSLAEYLCAATDRLLAEHFIGKLPGDQWTKNVQGTAIQQIDNEQWELHFAVRDEKEGEEDGEEGDRKISTNAAHKDPNSPVLKLSSLRIVNDRRECKVYKWRGHDDAATPASLQDMVTRIAMAVQS